MQVDTDTIADVGTVARRTNHPAGDGIPGDDFTLVKLDPAVVSQWGVNPAIPVIGGPNGVYADCGPESVRHYGHGYGVLVAQGKPEAGLATSWFENSYGWLDRYNTTRPHGSLGHQPPITRLNEEQPPQVLQVGGAPKVA